MIDNAYGAPSRHFSLPSEGYVEAPWSLKQSHHWYDVTVTDGAAFLRRFAGHIENGKASISDPAATEVISSALTQTALNVPAADEALGTQQAKQSVNV